MPIVLNETKDGKVLEMQLGGKKQEKGMATFRKPFPKATIRYFGDTALEEARQWLKSD